MGNIYKPLNATKKDRRLILAVKPFFILYGMLNLLCCCLIAYLHYFRYGEWDGGSIVIFIIAYLPLMLFVILAISEAMDFIIKRATGRLKKGEIDNSALTSTTEVCFLMVPVLIILGTFMFWGMKNYALSQVPADGNINLRIKWIEVEEVENNSVGNSWNHFLKVGNEERHIYVKAVEKDDIIITRNMKDTIAIDVRSKELDSVEDIGTATRIINISDLTLNKDNFYDIDVKVWENRGKYSGNTATQRFKIDIVRDMSFIEVIFSIFK